MKRSAYDSHHELINILSFDFRVLLFIFTNFSKLNLFGFAWSLLEYEDYC